MTVRSNNCKCILSFCADKPGILDMKGKAKWEAWNLRKGKKKIDPVFFSVNIYIIFKQLYCTCLYLICKLYWDLYSALVIWDPSNVSDDSLIHIVFFTLHSFLQQGCQMRMPWMPTFRWPRKLLKSMECDWGKHLSFTYYKS